jgi:3-phosphoshikimate 1-carboxyvinyltransferase
LLQALDVPVAMLGSLVELDPATWDRRLPSVSGRIPGDLSAALVLLAAATLVSGSRVCVRDVGLNQTRIGALQLLSQMGGSGSVMWEVHEHTLGEPSGIACASYAPLVATAMGGETAARAGDALGVLVALAVRAEGTSVITSPRVFGKTGEELAAMVRAFGAEAELAKHGLVVQGRPMGPLACADVDARDDPDLGAAGVLLGLVGGGPTRVRRIGGMGRRFRRIIGTLRALGADLRIEPGPSAARN